MAAILTQGRRFNLSSGPSNKNSSVLYVKLTDSSLKAIEEYQQAKNLKRKASISFSETIGVVSFPQKDSETPRTFDFTIQPSQNDDCFQCIKHSKANGASNLESLGVLSQKLTIQAGDDVYENTIKKMSIVEGESKKPRTKEIKSSGPNNGSRLRKILRNVARNNQNPSSARSSRSQTVSSSTQRKQATASINAQPRVTPASRAALSSSPNGRISPFPTTSKEKNGASVTAAPIVVTAAMSFALRDRIIHLLAIKNYKKPELLLKLQLDGLSDKDKDLFMPTLEQVAQVNSRDNSYSLQRHLYTNEVKHEWPLYSDNDRQQLNKKLSWLSLNPPLNPRTISPCPSNGSQGSPPRTKRSTELVDLAPKRLTDVQDGATGAAWSGSASKRPNDAPGAVPPPKKVRVAHNAKREKGRPSSLAQSIQNGLPSQGYSLQTGSATSGVSPSSDMTEDLADASCDPEDDDFKRIFTMIQSYEQRCRYKMEFNKGHKEHQEVYSRISNKVANIVELQAQIMQEMEGTPRYDGLRNEIYEEYFRLKNDSDYVKDRNRYESLVKKLAHIKQLVYAYDHDHPATK